MEHPYKTCNTLIERLNDPDDINAWNEFQLFYRDLINGWAKQKGCSESQIDDVYQETMIALMKNIDKFVIDNEKGYFRSYLKTIVSRRIVDSFYREKKYVSLLGDDEKRDKIQELPDNSSVSDQDMDIIWVKNVLKQALRNTYKKLDQQTYQSFVMHVLEGRNVTSVAKLLNIQNERNIYEHKRRTFGIIKNEFISLMKNMNDSDLYLSLTDSRNLEEALKNMFEENSDCQDTISNPTVSDQALLKQIKFAMSKIKKTNLPKTHGAYLISFSKNSTEPTLLEGRMTFGRSKMCDFLLNGHGISRVHGSIYNNEGHWILKDEESINGIYLNGKKIENETFLKDGDIVQIPIDNQFVFCHQE